MMNLKLSVLLCLSLLLSACQKRKYPDDQVRLEKEAIFFEGYFGDEPVSLKIGKDAYYCYSSYKQRPDSVYVFEGELKRYNCNPCSQALRVELSDYTRSLPGASVMVDSTFKKGSRNFLPTLDKPHTLKFAAVSNKTISSVRWNTSNGISSDQSVLNSEFGQLGVQTISLTVTTKDNCESRIINKIFVEENDVFACFITAATVQNNKSQFNKNTTGGKAPFSYRWEFGDGSSSTLADPDHDYKWAGSYPVKLKVTDSENKTCESNYVHVAGNDKSSCTSNMSLTYTGRSKVVLNGIKIQWTDQSNVVLRSDKISQPSGSYFEILKSEAYEPNDRGESGRLLTLRFNVLLSDGTRKVWFKSENAAIVVAYK